MKGLRLSIEDGQLIDLNVEHVTPLHESVGFIVQGFNLMIGLGNEQFIGNQGSDPFNLGPIIEKTMHRLTHGKKQKQNKQAYVEAT
ncbi:hypothetical protein Pyn_41204 [Prunus yedoensis var. nudiflora]|uniref:Uncharacterized protein n=1 Tax=Prunus yedoensis var. nudiflora TaxID=2094558 RepID=A0A314UC89_PRUYE|nr:hypothetical protein Pyn_41204 [Prunus yedoensis var. nudiflora]